MTPEQQRVAIAKACGWLDIQRCGRSSLKPHRDGAEYRGTKDAPCINYGRDYMLIPRYIDDLNAMYDAESMLSREQTNLYRMILANVLADCSDRQEEWKGHLCHATAAHLAEAFLKTLNLWKPTTTN